MFEQQIAVNQRAKFGQTIQVRLVSNLGRSQAYYRDVLGCKIDEWGHAERDHMCFLLQQAVSIEDVQPNRVSQKRSDYPTEWEGPDQAWDTFIHVTWEDLDALIEEVRGKGGRIATEPFTGAHGNWEFKNAYIQDPDGYNLVLGAMRQIQDK
ncbi:VOC family protein [Paenibacillus qinlingensis]|uniref:Enzyme related to lactoylglutathione lyase n=1 Tax=Paenibacillus qinlingensis TaxID=1837343 RepID=A0ABU1NRR2_9BACL|nr:VOC family protein [Paenibacillus qinlingensis]MDR6550039.1 putative enzyme related to lactoylglutathione lyase [Paenibacillus qinlingensis]